MTDSTAEDVAQYLTACSTVSSNAREAALVRSLERIREAAAERARTPYGIAHHGHDVECPKWRGLKHKEKVCTCGQDDLVNALDAHRKEFGS